MITAREMIYYRIESYKAPNKIVITPRADDLL